MEAVYGKLEELMQAADSQDLHRGFQEEDLFMQWKGTTTATTETDDEEYDVSCGISERLKNRTVGKALAEARRGFQARATKMRKSTPGAPHRLARGTIDKPDEIVTPHDGLLLPQR
eukprot:2548069-Pyramimonas_sp.AAC.1